MKKTFVLAACAALSLAVAACGDDDDASGDTSALTIADSGESSPSPIESAPAGTEAATESGDTSGDTAATASAAEIDPDVAADCEQFATITVAETQPAIGEEITDEYKDELRATLDALEDLDLETDGAEAARDAISDQVDELLDADTMTEELAAGLDEELPDEVVEFGEQCAAAMAANSGG